MAKIGNVGVSSDLSSAEIGSGLFVYCTDTGELYVDYENAGKKARGQVKMAGSAYVSGVTISGGNLKVTKGDGSSTNVPIGNYAGSSSNGGAANSVKSSMVIKLNGGTTEGTNQFTYNGSAGKSLNITPASIGAAASSHSQAISTITGLQDALDAKLGSTATAAAASKLATARTITLSGDVTGSVSFDGSKNVTITTDVPAMRGATSSAAGAAGLVPAPTAGSANKYLRNDGTWATPPDTNTTYSNMGGSSTSAAGRAGLVPAPAKGANNRYLRCDGTWSVPPDTNTTYSLSSFGISATAAELNKLDGVTVGATQFNYLSGVTSNIQTQLNNLSSRITNAQNTANTANTNATNAQNTANAALSNANAAKSVTDKYSAMLNIIGNGQ